jgi:hypothetical protein
MQKEKKRKNFLLEAGDHIHIARKDMNLAVIKPPTGLASSLTLLKTGKKKKKKKQKKESQENYNSRSNEEHIPQSSSMLLLCLTASSPRIQYYCTGRGRDGGKKTQAENKVKL